MKQPLEIADVNDRSPPTFRPLRGNGGSLKADARRLHRLTAGDGPISDRPLLVAKARKAVVWLTS